MTTSKHEGSTLCLCPGSFPPWAPEGPGEGSSMVSFHLGRGKLRPPKA